MNNQTKKETSTLPTKAQVEISEKRKKEKLLPLEYTTKSGTCQAFLDQALGINDPKCVVCGKTFIKYRGREYAYGDCCSNSCATKKERENLKQHKIPHTKPVDMFTREGGYVMSFSCSEEAAKYVGLKKPHSIRECCLGKTKTSAGFVFRYREANND